MSERTCLFTIASKNYLGQVRTLFDSVRLQHPEFARYLVLCDEIEGCFDPAREDCQILLAKDLGIDGFRRMAFQYNLMEFNTAVKPSAFRVLFDRFGFDRVIYLDPDIVVYRRLEELDELLADHDVVLTPHLTDALPDDGCQPDERRILQAGTYNLGFAAFRRGATAMRLLEWWRKHLARDCRVALEKGLFVDQKWMDLIPGFAERTGILRHPGYNVAYWNLPHRLVTRGKDGTFLVNSEPLAFFHFSGFHPSHKLSVSKHSNRRFGEALTEAAKCLLQDYRDRLAAQRFAEASSWKYAYGRFVGGPQIPDVCRTYAGATLLDELPADIDPFDPASGHPSVFERLQSPVPGTP